MHMHVRVAIAIIHVLVHYFSMGEIKTRRLGPKSKSDRCRGGTQNQINPGHGQQQLGVPSRKDNKDILAVIAIGWQLSIKTPRGFWSNRVVKMFCCAAVLLYMCCCGITAAEPGLHVRALEP